MSNQPNNGGKKPAPRPAPVPTAPPIHKEERGETTKKQVR